MILESPRGSVRVLANIASLFALGISLSACGGHSGLPAVAAGSGSAGAGTTASAGTNGATGSAGVGATAGTTGATAGTAGNGGLLQTASDTTGSVVGTPLYTAGSALGTTGNLLNQTALPVGSVPATVSGAGSSLSQNGLAGAPVVGATTGTVITTGDSTANPLATVTGNNSTVVGSASGTPALNASVLSSATPIGSPITAGALNTSNVASASVNSVPVAGTGLLGTATTTATGATPLLSSSLLKH